MESLSDPVDDQSFAYSYDNIGNRTASLRKNDEMDYTANSLNQYTQRTIPGIIDMLGSAETDTVVTVNSLATTRHGKYWYRELGVTNSSSAVYQSVNVVGTYTPPDTNDPDIVTSVTGHVFVAQTPEAFTYDDDGNLLSDGRFNYAWDSENRLISAETLTNLLSSVPRVKVEFAYDYMSRRVSKTVYNLVSNSWSQTESRKFVYDGWNLISERFTSDASQTTNSYVWGLDLSGSLQGAGGIGGLLAAKLGTNSVVYSYDGNGNVSELADASTGSVKAHYEYDPFGETLVSVGDLASENPFRFSTKYCDPDCNLYDFGMRWYSESLGRFANRDPIGDTPRRGYLLGQSINEQSLLDYARKQLVSEGLSSKDIEGILATLSQILRQPSAPSQMMADETDNLYRLCGNDPINSYDILGLKSQDEVNQELLNAARAAWFAAQYAVPGSEFAAALEVFGGCTNQSVAWTTHIEVNAPNMGHKTSLLCRPSIGLISNSLGLINAWTVTKYKDCIADPCSTENCDKWLDDHNWLTDIYNRNCRGN